MYILMFPRQLATREIAAKRIWRWQVYRSDGDEDNRFPTAFLRKLRRACRLSRAACVNYRTDPICNSRTDHDGSIPKRTCSENMLGWQRLGHDRYLVAIPSVLDPVTGAPFDFVIIFEEVSARIAFKGEYLSLLILVFRVNQLEVDSSFADAQHRYVSPLPFDG